jgi:TonB family protein
MTAWRQADGKLGSAAATALHNRALCHLAAGHLSEADSDLERARELLERPEETDHKTLAHLLNSHAALLRKLNRTPEAEQLKARSEELRNSRHSVSSNPSPAKEPPVDFGPYMKALQRKIKGNWHPPKGLESKQVVVIFSISREGQLSRLRVVGSSGVEKADQAAMEAVTKSPPFDPLPKGAPESIDIQFTFEYNVFFPARYPQW